MVKIREAIEKTREERDGLNSPHLDIVPFPGKRSDSREELSSEREMIALYRNLDAALGDVPRKVVQFIGAKRGEGTSSIVRDFAMVCALRLGKSVLLLDADQQAPCQHIFFRIDPKNGQELVVQDKETFQKALVKVGESELYVCVYPSLQSSSFFHHFLYSQGVKDFWEDLRGSFDLILIDSAPAADSPDGIRMSRFVDGVVMIVDAETTRVPVAESLKEEIAGNGGNILGIVFNKHRHYIPDFIYKRL